jgi:dipeptidyl aminopeptidase/acylaminoacyl peptidase
VTTAVGRHIYLVKVDGSGLRQLTSGGGFDENPAFSPNGKQVAFDRHVGTGKAHIFSVKVDGDGVRQLTDGSFNDSEPVYMPSGKRILFVSDRDHDVRTDRSDIFAMAPNGTNQRVLIDGPRNEDEPDTAQTGRSIAFVSNRAAGINIFVARCQRQACSPAHPQQARLLQRQLQPQPRLGTRRQAHRLSRRGPLQQRSRGDAGRRQWRQGVFRRQYRRRRLRHQGRTPELGTGRSTLASFRGMIAILRFGQTGGEEGL